MKTLIHRQWLPATALPFLLALVIFSCKDDSCPDPVCLNGGAVEAGKCDCNCENTSFTGEFCQTPVIPTEGLVAYYPFDNNTKDFAPVSTPNDGTIYGTVQFVPDRKGENSKAVSLDGVYSFVLIDHSSRINFVRGQDFTISVWLKFGDQGDVVANVNHVLTKRLDNDAYPFALRVHNQTAATSLKKKVWAGRYDGPSTNPCSGTGTASFVISKDPLSDKNKWYHVVLRHQSNKINLYIDSEPQTEKTEDFNCEVGNTAPLYVGRANNDLDHNYNGYLDDLRIYNRALNEGEILALWKE